MTHTLQFYLYAKELKVKCEKEEGKVLKANSLYKRRENSWGYTFVEFHAVVVELVSRYGFVSWVDWPRKCHFPPKKVANRTKVGVAWAKSRGGLGHSNLGLIVYFLKVAINIFVMFSVNLNDNLNRFKLKL